MKYGLKFIVLCALGMVFVNSLSCKPRNNSSTAKANSTASQYVSKIEPILEQKCVACHSCSQSPCQFNLTSYEGMMRGAINLDLYAKRFTREVPKRMFIDGQSESDWRTHKFWSVTAPFKDSSTLLEQMLDLKTRNPQAKITSLPEIVTKESDMCPHPESKAEFVKHYEGKSLILRNSKAAYGMPYGLPGLSSDEQKAFTEWIAAKTPGPSDEELKLRKEPVDPAVVAQISEWEDLLNEKDIKKQLTARYIYEHLFLANIYFTDATDSTEGRIYTPGEYFRLVRAFNQDGSIEAVSTAVRPFDPASDSNRQFYYRFMKVKETIMSKNHIPYALSKNKMTRLKELFYDSDWTATKLPPYGAEGSNPFRTFAEIPAWARYQFLLDDALFFTQNDIKGPVCNGDLATNVIQDQGWRIYLKPELDPTVTDANFFKNKESNGQQVMDLLRMPAETKDSSVDAAKQTLQREFLSLNKSYTIAKDKSYGVSKPRIGISDIWRGNGNSHHNLKHGAEKYPGAAQTIFRHYDSATVLTGLFGDPPKNVELFDFPLMERTYYNLVAGFNVYGSIIDGYITRAYKDSLRIEAEDNFLKLYPRQFRSPIRKYWYSSITNTGHAAMHAWIDLWNPLLPNPNDANRDTLDTYTGLQNDTKPEDVSTRIMRKLASTFRNEAIGQQDLLNCAGCGPLNPNFENSKSDIDRAVSAAAMSGGFVQYLPELMYLRINDGQTSSHSYTITANRDRKNIKFLIAEELTLTPEKDTLSIIKGVIGAYPNLFFEIQKGDLQNFLKKMQSISSKAAYEEFRSQHAIPRDSPKIWEMNDWLFQQAQAANPVDAGRMDLSRYEIFYRN
ncbi:MAG: fatty acid cis/trans isomerase [Proteobacteria bacterium]|nr:fatty acid cis/trans isomerase [Pseudomonadota bacterium]